MRNQSCWICERADDRTETGLIPPGLKAGHGFLRDFHFNTTHDIAVLVGAANCPGRMDRGLQSGFTSEMTDHDFHYHRTTHGPFYMVEWIFGTRPP